MGSNNRPLHDPVTWHGINYIGTQITQGDFQNKGKSGWTGTSSFVLEVRLRNLRPSVIYSVPCDRIVQRAYFHVFRFSLSGNREVNVSRFMSDYFVVTIPRHNSPSMRHRTWSWRIQEQFSPKNIIRGIKKIITLWYILLIFTYFTPQW